MVGLNSVFSSKPIELSRNSLEPPEHTRPQPSQRPIVAYTVHGSTFCLPRCPYGNWTNWKCVHLISMWPTSSSLRSTAAAEHFSGELSMNCVSQALSFYHRLTSGNV